MRSREEILEGVAEAQADDPSLTQSATLSAILEVLLDMRDGLTETHKWAARVGMYNDEPIWGNIFENIRKGRERASEENT